MIRLLMVEDDTAAAELTLAALRSHGLSCQCERVESEPDFRDALTRAPDLILSDSNVPGFAGLAALAIAKAVRPATPFIFVSGHLSEPAVRRALKHGAADYLSKSDLSRLPSAVQSALGPAQNVLRRATDAPRSESAGADHRTATYLLERQAVLDKTLEDGASLANLLTRHPPIPAALVLIESPATRERYFKVLRNANIEVDIATHRGEALSQLAGRVHAVLFTDQLGVIQAARQLEVGSATHIVFVHSSADDCLATQALRAGANDITPVEARGEHFWAHLTNARRIISFAASLQSAVTDNRILATIDELTRCGNRHFFEHQFPREVARARRLQRSLTLILCDIDHFKSINDQRGHPIGDEVLQQFGERLMAGLRLGEDWVARIGGEEFAIVLPDTARLQAVTIAERLCDRIRETGFLTSAGSLPVTASFGLCAARQWSGSTRDCSDRMVRVADAALYSSKHNGRNRITEGPFDEKAS